MFIEVWLSVRCGLLSMEFVYCWWRLVCSGLEVGLFMDGYVEVVLDGVWKERSGVRLVFVVD